MNDSVPDDLLEINDPEIDAAALMAQIRERMRQRRIALGLDDRSFPSYDVTSCPPEPQDLAFDANLYHHLRLANELYAQGDTEPALPPSPLSRLPVFGRLWQRLRPSLHVLILFYVNRALAQQVTVNRHLVSVLNQLTVQSQAQQRAIAALQSELQTLRQADVHS
jgi:hypothetical protein